MNIKYRGPVLVPDTYRFEIAKLSKAALMDVVWSLCMRCAGEDNVNGTIQTFREEREAILLARK